MAYEHIFTPLQVGSLTLENRILLPPMVTFGLSGADGNVTQDVIRHYAARARGGAGHLIVEATCVHPNGKLTEHQLGLWDDAQIEGHQMLTCLLYTSWYSASRCCMMAYRRALPMITVSSAV